MHERPTPETDALAGEWIACECVPVSHSRKQERERDEAFAKLTHVYRWVERNHPDGFIDSQSHLQNLERVTEHIHDKMDKLERERDEAIALLESEKSTALFAGPMRSAMVFAARYTHTRNTGGTLAVVRALEQCWHVLDDNTRDQILRESHEAEYNLDDWQRLRDFAANDEMRDAKGETKL